MKKTGILLLIIFVGSALAKPKWELIAHKDGVKVYKRELPDNIIEFKGTAYVKAPPLQLIAILMDYPGYMEWQPDVLAVKNLKQISETELVLYWALNLPWPVQDRDTVVYNRIIIDGKNKWFHVKWRETKHPKAPPKSGFTRVPVNRGKWSVKPLKSGQASWLEFSGYGDPGGFIPKWLVRWVSKYQVVDGIKRIRKRLQAKKFSKKIQQKYKQVGSWK